MPHQELYNKLFKGNTENSNPKEMLQNIVSEFPYFSLAHFFLLKETPASDFNFRKVASKTALHFDNPFMLKYQLNRKFREGLQVGEDQVGEVVEVTQVGEVAQVAEVGEVLEVLEVSNPLQVSEVAAAVVPVDVVEVEEVKKQEELLFEPLHTTDYFASQGIKLSEEVQTGDKLGKQLKSFTDWLKTMKKTQQGKLPAGNPGIDLAVQNLAEKSNKEQEVLTESMAEVFLQQGKKGKAREIYKKLSLLNPAKSAYFAAKIELLKEN